MGNYVISFSTQLFSCFRVFSLPGNQTHVSMTITPPPPPLKLLRISSVGTAQTCSFELHAQPIFQLPRGTKLQLEPSASKHKITKLVNLHSAHWEWLLTAPAQYHNSQQIFFTKCHTYAWQLPLERSSFPSFYHLKLFLI